MKSSLSSMECLVIIAMISLAGLSIILPVEGQGSSTDSCSSNSVPHGCLLYYLTDFQEQNGTVTLSVHFDVELHASGNATLGVVYLLLSTAVGGPAGGFNYEISVPATGSYLDRNKTVAMWAYNFVYKLQALGSTDFYPYDSWLFGLTLGIGPFWGSNEINSTTLYTHMQNFVTGWDYECLGNCFSPSMGGGSILTSVVLSKVPGQTLVPAEYVPWILWFMLGISVLIPPDDLASKTTVYISIIFSLGGILFSRVISFQASGTSYFENTLYYILFMTSLYLLEAIFEKLILAHEESISSVRRWPLRRLGVPGLRIILEVCFVTVAMIMLALHYYTYASLHSYFWVVFPSFQTLLLPAILVASPTLANVYMIGRNMNHKKSAALTPFVFE